MRTFIKKFLFIFGLMLPLQQLSASESDVFDIDYEQYPTEDQEEANYGTEEAYLDDSYNNTEDNSWDYDYEDDEGITQELYVDREEELQRLAQEHERQRAEAVIIAYEQLLKEQREKARLEEERQRELNRQQKITEAEQRRVREEEQQKLAERKRLEAERHRIAAELQRQADEDERKAQELRQRTEAERALLEAERQREEALHRHIAEAERKARELQRLKKLAEEKLKKERQEEAKRQRRIEHEERKNQELHQREQAKQERLAQQRQKAAAAEQEKLRLKEEARKIKEHKKIEREQKLLAAKRQRETAHRKHVKALSEESMLSPQNQIDAAVKNQVHTAQKSTLPMFSSEWFEGRIKLELNPAGMKDFHRKVRVLYTLINASKDPEVIAARTIAHQARDPHPLFQIPVDPDTNTCLRTICAISAYSAAQKYSSLAAATAALHATQQELCATYKDLNARKLSFDQYYHNGLASGDEAARTFMAELQEPEFKRYINDKVYIVTAADEVATAAVQRYLATTEKSLTPTRMVRQQETAKSIYAATFSIIASPENQQTLLVGNQKEVEPLITRALDAGSEQTTNLPSSATAALQSFSATIKQLATPPSSNRAPYHSFALGVAIIDAKEKISRNIPQDQCPVTYSTKTFVAALHNSVKELSDSMQVHLTVNKTESQDTKTLVANLLSRRGDTKNIH
jgi:hypothetical protein